MMVLGRETFGRRLGHVGRALIKEASQRAHVLSIVGGYIKKDGHLGCGPSSNTESGSGGYDLGRLSLQNCGK